MTLLGSLRNIVIRQLSATRPLPLSLLLLHKSSPSLSDSISGGLPKFYVGPSQSSFFGRYFSSSTVGAAFNSLTDARFPKRRPGLKSRRKRASLKPPGPYAWVQYVPGEPIPTSRPNEGSIKRRNEKKRIKQRKAFILSEKKKRKAQYAEARKKRDIERIERKMASVAREKAWAERLIELQQLKEAKKAAMA